MSEIFLFPYNEVAKGAKVVLYGAGMVAEDYVAQISKNHYCDILFIVSKDWNSNVRMGRLSWNPVAPEMLKERNDYEKIVISVYDFKFRDEIKKTLKNMGILEERIIDSVYPIQTREKSFSQHGEDMLILNAFKHLGYFKDGRKPSYIDVGAHDPYEISNTALLYQLGCRGINIEANPKLIAAFNHARPDDINLCVGIGDETGTFPFYITEKAGLNSLIKENISFNESLVEKDYDIKENYSITEVIDIPVETLPYIINKYNNGRWPDFMSIDIEGMEYRSLDICDFTFGPAIIAVEVNFDGDLFVEMMKEKGYFPYLWYRENIIFAKNDFEHQLHMHNERKTL